MTSYYKHSSHSNVGMFQLFKKERKNERTKNVRMKERKKESRKEGKNEDCGSKPAVGNIYSNVLTLCK